MTATLAKVTNITDFRGLSAAEIGKRLDPLSIDEKIDLLSQAVFGSVENIFWSACIATNIENSGGETNLIFGRWYRLMAEGQLSPEAFVRLAGRGRLLEKIAALPMSEQDRYIVKNEPIQVAEMNANGTVTYRQLRATEIDERLYRQVFGTDGVNTEGQQAAVLRYEANRNLPPLKDRQPVELVSLLFRIEELKNTIAVGDKREKKRAAKELCATAEKIALLVQ